MMFQLACEWKATGWDQQLFLWAVSEREARRMAESAGLTVHEAHPMPGQSSSPASTRVPGRRAALTDRTRRNLASSHESALESFRLLIALEMRRVGCTWGDAAARLAGRWPRRAEWWQEAGAVGAPTVETPAWGRLPEDPARAD
jgi:hypothetical protein